MVVTVYCIAKHSGVPLFIRNVGSTKESPSLSLLTALNGALTFGQAKGMKVTKMVLKDVLVIPGKEDKNYVCVGYCSGRLKETALRKVLDYIMAIMELIIGSEGLAMQRNTNILRRELQLAYPIMDKLLQSLHSGDSTTDLSSDLIGLVEIIMTAENNLIKAMATAILRITLLFNLRELQILLNTFSECINSAFSVLLIHGKIASATDNWWTLSPDTIKLLVYLAITDNSSDNLKDIPVFLSDSHPNVAYRFVSYTLLPNVQVCCLCGSGPNIEAIASNCFKSSTDILQRALNTYPRNIPSNVVLDKAIMGVLLIDCENYQFLMTTLLVNGNNKPRQVANRFDILRTFYYEMVMDSIVSMDKQENDETSAKLLETFWCSEYHKCHSFKSENNVLCALYSSSTPNELLRAISKSTLKLLLNNKQH